MVLKPMLTFLLFLIPLSQSATAQDSTLASWEIESSEVKYTVKHLLKTFDGISKGAKGKGSCNAQKECEFLVGIPVKTFDSENSNRDLHMLETVKGAIYPLITARMKFKNFPIASDSKPADQTTDAVISFAGKEHTYSNTVLHIVPKSSNQFEATLILPVDLSQYDVERPSLMTVSVQDRVPIHIHAVWKKTP